VDIGDPKTVDLVVDVAFVVDFADAVGVIVGFGQLQFTSFLQSGFLQYPSKQK